MKASKTEHKGEERIKVEFPYNQAIASMIKQIEGAKWSKTMNAWHIPYGKKEFNQLKALFPDIEYPQKVNELKTEDRAGITSQAALPPAVPFAFGGSGGKESLKNVSVQVIGRHIILKLPKNELDIHFIHTLKYSRWDSKQYCWIVPNYPGNLELINDFFTGRIYELIIHDEYEAKTSPDTRRVLKPNQLLIIKNINRRMKLIFVYNKELSYLLKNIPFSAWDAGNKWWTIPYSEKFIEQVKETAKARNLEILLEEEPERTGKAPRITTFDIPNYRYCPDEYILKLTEMRYSQNTVKIYKSLFEEFINYYHTYELAAIDERMIISFLRYLVMERKISPSYQNQSINSIKFYYERVLGGQRKIYLVERPRKEKTLPEVLSEAEIVEVIKHVSNIKHKAIVMVTYSGGLRLSEVVNLKIQDIDSKRMQIFVRQSKGRKDRYTLLSKKVLPVLRQYYEEFKPKDWLFEGVKGRKYSLSSVQTLVSEAYERAGIRKKVSTRTLRHSFATHLLENGTDLRYIQALLGHESSKTTEIYTHITTRGFDQIENPLDKLDF